MLGHPALLPKEVVDNSEACMKTFMSLCSTFRGIHTACRFIASYTALYSTFPKTCIENLGTFSKTCIWQCALNLEVYRLWAANVVDKLVRTVYIACEILVHLVPVLINISQCKVNVDDYAMHVDLVVHFLHYNTWLVALVLEELLNTAYVQFQC